MNVLPACISVFAMCVPGSCVGQKRASDPLELDLLAAHSWELGAGNWVLGTESGSSERVSELNN